MGEGIFRSRAASEALGVLLLLAGVLTLLSLFSYDPRDPNLFSLTTGAAESPTNWIGGFGASLALTDAGLVIGTPRARVAGHRWAGAVYAVPYGADWVDASRARRMSSARDALKTCGSCGHPPILVRTSSAE